MRDMIEHLVKKALEAFVTEEMIKGMKDVLILKLRELAASTENEIDDAIVDMIAKALD